MSSRYPITVLIPTHGRPTLLKRTLASLEACTLPESYHELVIIENGSRDGAEAVVANLPERLNARYMHRERGNKSYALNEALYTIKDGLLVFFDDDIWVRPQTLKAYAKRASETPRSGLAFWGGPFTVRYDASPPQWMVPHLPRSAHGWCLADPFDAFDELFLGFNWAAFKQDIDTAGGFDVNFGPGSNTGAVGQESTMQRLLLRRGLQKIYVPDASVEHYVPTQRLNAYWLVNRKYREGVEVGLSLTGESLTVGGIPGFLYRCISSLGRAGIQLIVGEKHAAIGSLLGIPKHAGVLRGAHSVKEQSSV